MLNISETRSVVAGICNITGSINPYEPGWSHPIAMKDANGAFYTLGSGTVMTRKESGSTTYGIGFNASRSNGIFGKSSTVTPLSRKCRFLICYKK